MKQTSILFMLIFILTGCIDTSTKKSSNTNSSSYCIQYPYASGCVAQSTSGGTSGGGSQVDYCTTNPKAYGCPNYCNQTPIPYGCPGSTVGSNPYTQVPTVPYNPNWDVHYPGGEPQGSCSTPTDPQGVPNAYGTRKGTITLAGGYWYNPASPEAASLLNTSSILKSVEKAKTFFMTDSMLKVRFKVHPQPDSAKSTSVCSGRVSGNSTIAGYTKLKFNVQVVGVASNNSIVTEPLGYHTVVVNSCSPGIDLSPYKAMYPNGIYLIISDVRGNQGQYPADYSTKGWTNSDSFVPIRSSDCWSMDLEVAADGTKTFE
jgi:hypothetical protein